MIGDQFLSEGKNRSDSEVWKVAQDGMENLHFVQDNIRMKI